MQNKEFREDLYYRLNVIRITLPSLRERSEDMESFINHFASRQGLVLSSEAVSVFRSYPWPGNIRELKNTIVRAKALFINEVIDKEKANLVLDHGEEVQDEEVVSTLSLMEKSMILKNA